MNKPKLVFVAGNTWYFSHASPTVGVYTNGKHSIAFAAKTLYKLKAPSLASGEGRSICLSGGVWSGRFSGRGGCSHDDDGLARRVASFVLSLSLSLSLCSPLGHAGGPRRPPREKMTTTKTTTHWKSSSQNLCAQKKRASSTSS